MENTRSENRIISKANLPTVDVDWLNLKDHFIATVGPTSGQGSKFGNYLF